MYKAGKQKFFIVIFTLSCFFYSQKTLAQFEPGPQNSNSSAIHKDDSQFSFWANEVTVARGFQNIADTTLGKTTFGTENNVVGKANNSTISLGDSGTATIHFPYPIYNISGFDFAVFENGIEQNGSSEDNYFLELAIVEVSENGIDFIPFESTSNTDASTQTGSFGLTNCTKINNLAGKYPLNYGTPFNIDELGLDSILAIRITDVVGSLNDSFTTFDSQGNKINDPFPTAFPSGGFDLNAIGALNQPNVDTIPIDTINSVFQIDNYKIKIFPNPINKNQVFFVHSINNNNTIEIFSIVGKKVFSTNFEKEIKVETFKFEKGIYFIKINNNYSQKIIIK